MTVRDHLQAITSEALSELQIRLEHAEQTMRGAIAASRNDPQ